jgi:hypothetical protein
MTNPDRRGARAPWPRWRRWLLTLLVVGGVGALIWSQLPRAPYPTDLTRIGAGRPVLVLAQDANFGAGMAVMELMNVVREDYPEVEFLVAHLGLPDGQAFARRHSVSDGVLVLFGADGERVATLHHPQDVEELRGALDTAFGR